MSIHGIRSPYGAPVRPQATPVRPDHAGTAGGAQRAGVPAPAAAPATSRPAVAGAASGVPVQPPQGTDPELWGVLTQDERAYFAKLGAMGPLTYGRVLSGQMPTSAPMARGGRLDVKA
ncbi:MAG: hypothetical protein IT360_27580 [Gemmatimonadaceae bacterium]|nr:hypothetical protein [Gemmatimonadaceae bacterium]